eukprot:g6304.t1
MSLTSMSSDRKITGPSEARIPNAAYYAEYHGHKLAHLHRTRDRLAAICWPERKNSALADAAAPLVEISKENGGFIYLLGDSTLDNKHWLYSNAIAKTQERALLRDGLPACNGYEHILSEPKRSMPDVAYWLNRAIADSRDEQGAGEQDEGRSMPRYIAINAAVEESTLGQRFSRLLPHDAFVAEQFGSNDVLVFSCGGNDIALAPSAGTIFNIAAAVLCASTFGARSDGYTLGLGHFADLFGKQTENFVRRVVGHDAQKKRPKLVVVCMLYFLDEDGGAESWANATLGFLRYNKDPGMLQNFIRYCYREGTKKIKVDEVPVLAVPLFETLDGKDTRDYVARVEPSAVGGEKLGHALWHAIQEKLKEIAGSD